ncbi:SPY [Symbiodinium pilosum]|uniref:SPY protein n=1 Tax=Symbiodinium pilosum TaxID=2952 RepID=A0A812M9U9_SYMPI|nr:SPY [Symbiodinium pilosum]
MGLETSCLVQPGAPRHQIQGGYTSTGCFVPGNSCMGPGACMNRDARNVKNGEARAGRHGPLLESLALRPLPTGTGSPFCGPDRGVTLEAKYSSSEEACKAAKKFAVSGDAQQALVAYSHALEMDENNASVCDDFGQFLLAHGQLAGAEYLFQRAVSLDPLNAQYCYRKGVVLQQQRQLKQAVEAFMAALSLKPQFLGALFNLGVVHRELGQITVAAEQFKRLLQLNAEDPCALAMLGECQAELGDLEAAIKSLEGAVRLDPENRSAQKDLMRLRQQVGQIGRV